MRWIQRIATIYGIGFIAAGVLGFVAAGSVHSMMSMSSTAMLLGIFPVNVLHNLVHIAFGVWGILAGRSRSTAISYTLGSGAVYLLLAIAGMLSPTMGGFVPLGGYDIELHLALAVLLAGAGIWAAWIAPQVPATEQAAAKRAS